MRIAVGGIGHETNTFSTLPTRLSDFAVMRGDEGAQGAVWDCVRADGVEVVHTLTASAPPSGLVERGAYRQLKGDLLDRLHRAGPLDGVCLSLHGAMEVQGIGDGEGDLAMAVREAVGPGVPVAAGLDLHGNISPELVRSVNILTALRTAPHRDGDETCERAVSHLLRAIRGGLRPVTLMVKLPLLLPGEYAVTEVEPAQSLYAMLPVIDRMPGLMDASIMIGCAWTDSVHTSVSTLVTAESDVTLARREATRLAAAMWERRRDFGPDVETASIDEAIARAMSAREAPVFLSDSGDNVTAGGAGDSPRFVERLLAAGATDAVVAGLTDAEAVAACARAGVGAAVSLSLGGRLDRANAAPLPVTGRIARLDPPDAPTLAVLQVQGVTVLLQATRDAFDSPRSFARTGVDPMRQKIVVVKLGYLFPQLRDVAPRSILALSPGFTDLQLPRLPYRNIRRPVYPLDQAADWRPADAMGPTG